MPAVAFQEIKKESIRAVEHVSVVFEVNCSVLPKGVNLHIVEMIGPPGSGKTTFLKSILRAQALSTQFLVGEKRILLKEPRKAFVKIPLLAFGLSMRCRVFERFFLKNGCGFKYSSEYEVSEKGLSDFVHYSVGLIHSRDVGWLYKTMIAKWWIDTFIDRLHLGSAGGVNIVCLDDEPLSYRLSLFDERDDELSVYKYYELMPLPSAVIYLMADQDELFSRIRCRRRIALRHIGLSSTELLQDLAFSVKVAEIAKEVLELRGAPVLRIDSSVNLSENVSTAMSFIQQLFGGFSSDGKT